MGPPNTKAIISATVLAMSVRRPSPNSRRLRPLGPLRSSLGCQPAPVTNFYKQNVYDPSDDKIGHVDDVLIDKEGRVTAMIIGVGGFLVLNTNKEALKTAPWFSYDKTKTTSP